MSLESLLLFFHLLICNKISAIKYLLVELEEPVKCSKWKVLGGIEIEKESFILCGSQPCIILYVHAHACTCVCTDAVS